MTSRPCLVIFGPQGVGKGTQAERLAPVLDIEHLSTGALLRRSVQHQTALGSRVGAFLERGELVPDEVMLDVVHAEIARLDAAGRGYILDGFPRTIDQAVALTSMLDAPLGAAIELTAPLDVLLDRLTRRRVCPGCGAVTTAPAGYIATVACPNGDGIAVRRADDNPAAIAQRLAIYDRNVQPLLQWFRGASRVITVAGDGPADEVHDQICHTLTTTFGHAVRPSCRLAVAQGG